MFVGTNMSDVDLIISVHTTGVKDIANLSASVRNLALNLKGVTVPMKALDTHAKAVNKALGITSKGVNQHANSLKELKRNQAALSEESKRLRSNIQNYNLAILKAGGPTTKLGKELTFAQNQLKAFSTTLRGLRIRSFGSDLSNISLRLQKMGKDAQFVGRSLMINLTAPLLLFARTGLQSLVKVDAALVRLTKVLEGVAMTAEQADKKLGKGLGGAERQAAIEKMVNSFKSLDSALTGLSNKFGVSKDLVVGLATDFAELGISVNENITALTELTLVTEKLGNMDAAGAQDLAQALYFNSVRALEANGAFAKLTNARDRETRAIAAATTQLNMFNNIENVTALTLKDLSESLPELGSMAVSFGLSMTEAAALLAPMKAAGLDVGASANSIKVSLQRAISPTKQNTELLASLAKQYGVASDTQNVFNKTTETGLTGLQGIVDVFMKVQASSAGAEGALKLMSEIFEKRQGPRMYIAIQQMGQFDKELNKATRSASTSEGILASVAEGALSKFNQLNSTALPTAINNFSDIGIIARIATAQAGQMVEGYGKVSAAEIKTAKEVRKAVADVVVQKKQSQGIDIIGTAKTESGRAMLVELAGASNAQEVANMELEQSLGSLEVAIQKIKNAFKLFAADLMKTIGPALKSMADKIQVFYEKWQSLSESTRQNISKVILGFLAFLAILGPVVLAIGTIQASMGVLGRALTGLLPKLATTEGGFVGLGTSASLANAKVKALYGTIVAKSLKGKLLGAGTFADAQATAQAAMGNFAAPKAAAAPTLSSLLSPVNKGKITQSEQLKEFLSRNAGATKGDFLKSRTIANKMAAGRALTPAQYAYQITNSAKVASIPGAVTAGRATAASKIAGINANITSKNTIKTAKAARQNLINARNPFYEATGIVTDRMGTRFFRGGEELLDDVGPTRPTRTRGVLSKLTGGRISATRKLIGTAEDQANILAGGGMQGAKLQTQLRARKAVGGIKDFATTSKTANLGKGFVEALRPIKQFKAGVNGAKGAMAALEAQQATLGLAGPGAFRKMGVAIKGFVTNVKLADLAMKIFRMTMLATGIGAIVLGIGVAVMLVVKNFGMFKEKAAGPLRGLAFAFGVIKKALMEITRPIQDLFAQFGGGAKGTEGSVNGLVTIFRQFVKVVQMVAQAFKSLVENIIKPYLYAVVNIVMAVVSMFKGNWGDALKFLTAAFARVAEVLVGIWQAVMKVLIKVAGFIVKAVITLFAGLMKGLVKVIALGVKLMLTSLTAIPKAVAKGFSWLSKIPGMGWFSAISDGMNNTIDGMYGMVDAGADAASGAIDALADGAKGLVDGGVNLYGKAIDGIANTIKGGLKRGADLGVKESTHSLQKGKKPIVDAGAEAGQEAGEAIANKTGDGFEENDPSGKIGEKLKEGIKSAVQDLQNYIAGELKNAIDKYVDASTKALEKQRDAALKIYDVQIKTLGKLEKAEESLTKTKEYEANKRKLLDDKALNDEQFRRNYALAVYEGRTDDARMLQLEQVSQTKGFNEELNSIESNRAKDLARENLDALKEAINEARDAAQKFFDESIVKFQESIETITKFPPVTIEDYKTQIGELYNITNQTATDNSTAFEKMFTNFATTINTKMPNDVVGAFSTNLDELVLVAKEKYGLGSDTSENTVIGVTIGMLADIGGVFGDKKQTVIDSFGLVTTGLKDNFKESATAIVTAVTDDFLTPFAEATTKFKDNWEKVYKQAIIDGNRAITDALRNDVSVNKELFEEMRGYIDATTLKWLGLKAAAEAAGEAQKDAAAGGGGGDSSTGSTSSGSGLNVGRADAFVTNNALRVARGLNALTYQQYTQGTGLSTAAVIAKPTTPSFIPNVPTNSFKPPQRAKGGIIPSRTQNQNSGFPEGYIPAPTQEGVPALLHGGEYILNAKAVSRIGIGALNKMNNNLLPRFLKGGVVPKKNGGSSTVKSNPSSTRGRSADTYEAASKVATSVALKKLATARASIPYGERPALETQKHLNFVEKAIFKVTDNKLVNTLFETKNFMETVGAAIGSVGGKPGMVAGSAIGRGIGSFFEQIIDNKKGVSTQQIAKETGFGAIHGSIGLGVDAVLGKVVSKIAPKILSKFARESVLNNLDTVAPTQIRGALPAAPTMLALGTGSPLDNSMLPALRTKIGAFDLNALDIAIGDTSAAYSSIPGFNIDGKIVTFGNIDRVLAGRANLFESGFSAINGQPFNPLDTVIKNIPSDPYTLSGLAEFSAAGAQTAANWHFARSLVSESISGGGLFGKPGDGLEILGSKITSVPQVDALLYASSNGDIYAKSIFEKLAELGKAKISAARAASFAKANIDMTPGIDREISGMPSVWQDLMKTNSVDEMLEKLIIVHERPPLRPFSIGKGGDLFLKPTGDYNPGTSYFSNIGSTLADEMQLAKTGGYFTTAEDLLKNPSVIGRMSAKDITKYNMLRNTIHFGINSPVAGHMARPEAGGEILLANLKAVMDANPGALDTLYAVDSYFTPKDLTGLRIPKDAFQIFRPSELATTSAPDYLIRRLQTGYYTDNQFSTISDQLFKDMKEHMISDRMKQLGGTGLWETGEHYTKPWQDAVIRRLALELRLNTGLHANHYVSTIESLSNDLNYPLPYNYNMTMGLEKFDEFGENALPRLITRRNNHIITYLTKKFSPAYLSQFKTGGYVPGAPSTAIPAILHGGEYVINADAVRNMGVRTMQSINQSRFRAPSATPSYSGGGGSTSVSTVNINVDTFIGEEEWFKSMMKDYNINVLPKQQKAAGLESRTFTSYNGINQGL
jgi:tetratricopeptide (TPR) repeat protein